MSRHRHTAVAVSDYDPSVAATDDLERAEVAHAINEANSGLDHDVTELEGAPVARTLTGTTSNPAEESANTEGFPDPEAHESASIDWDAQIKEASGILSPEQVPDLSTMMPGYLPLDSLTLVPGLYGRPNGHAPDHIQELADSIMDIGQQVPVEFVIGHDGNHLVTKGSGRITAMKKLRDEGKEWPGGPHVKVQLGDSDDLFAAFIKGAQENIHRDNLGPEEMVEVIEKLRQPPFNLKTDKEIAERLKVKRPTITQYSLYARRIPEIREAVRNGRMSFKASRHAPKKAEEQLTWFRGLEKQAAQRAAASKQKAPPGKKAAPARVTASMAERPKREPSARATGPVLSSGAMMRKDIALDLKGIVRSYCKDKAPETKKILTGVAAYLSQEINGMMLAGLIDTIVLTGMAGKTAKPKLPGNKPAKKGRRDTKVPPNFGVG